MPSNNLNQYNINFFDCLIKQAIEVWQLFVVDSKSFFVSCFFDSAVMNVSSLVTNHYVTEKVDRNFLALSSLE